MKNFAKKSASKRREKPAAVAAVAYTTGSAKNHWKGKRATEFGALLQEWNTTTGRKNSGGALLRELSAQCDKEDADSRGTQVEGADGLVVFEFTVTLQPGMTPIRVWRGLDGNAVPNLRLAPAPDNEQAHASLLKEMKTFAKNSASQRWEKPAAVAAFAYATDTARSHWKGKRATEFKALLQEWNTVTGSEKGGGALLQELSVLCDGEDARGMQVAISDDLVVFEFTVTLHPGMLPVTVWRGLDGNGMINLRLAPAPDDEPTRASLLTEMKDSAKKSARQRKN
jgi:uncharacterized protein YukE